MTISTDYLLHKNTQKKITYEQKNGFWWSAELRKWMVSDPSLIKKILMDNNFIVHNFDIKPLAVRFKVNLEHSIKVLEFVPLGVEGKLHSELRERYSKDIFNHLDAALETFEDQINLRVKFHCNSGKHFDLVKDLLQPSISKANLIISGINSENISDYESIPQLFDDTISLRKRLEIDNCIGRIFNLFPAEMAADERYYRIAHLAINSNTLLASLTESFVLVVLQHKDKQISQMDWHNEIPATGLRYIERKAVNEIYLAGNLIKAGDNFRLYLEEAGYQNDQGPVYSDLYFAAGPHKCIGMLYSKQVWKILVENMKKISKKVSIFDSKYRERDNVFNFYESLEVEFYG